MRGDGSGSDAVLARAGFRNDARLAHLHSQKTLANGVIDFVRAGVEQVLALEVDARAAELFREARSKLQRRGAAGKVFQQILKAGLERRVGFCEFVGALELKQRHHQRFGNVAAAVRAEASRRSRWRLENGAHLISNLFRTEIYLRSARRTS